MLKPEDFDLLEARVTHAEDVIAIQQLQSRFQHWLCLERMDKIHELFALNHLDVSVEVADSGVFVGPEGIKRYFKSREVPEVGIYDEQRAVNPVIVISPDGTTAKGVWFSPGIVTDASRNLQGWSWGKYDNEYVKEGGQWKIWHLRWRLTFVSSFEKGWLHEQMAVGKRRPPYYPPDQPTTYLMPYSTQRFNYMLPEPPDPEST